MIYQVENVVTIGACGVVTALWLLGFSFAALGDWVPFMSGTQPHVMVLGSSGVFA